MPADHEVIDFAGMGLEQKPKSLFHILRFRLSRLGTSPLASASQPCRPIPFGAVSATNLNLDRITIPRLKLSPRYEVLSHKLFGLAVEGGVGVLL